jgi:histidinol-phosphate aminotransferase
MSDNIKAKDSIYDIKPYVGGESNSVPNPELGYVIKLSSNEGPFGPSPKAMEAVSNITDKMHRYPDGGCTALRKALAEKNNINADNIVCGAGSDEIISFLCHSYVGEGENIVYSAHGFLMYAIYAKTAGGQAIAAPEKDLCADIDALLEAVNDKTKILFLANPNNPTGSYLKRDKIEELHARLPKNTILVLDAAYAEYVDDPDYTIGHDLVEKHDNVVVTRTFSKAYGLGGMRVGWGHASDPIVDVMNRVRGPFNVSNAGQAAALAAVQDEEFLQKSTASNKKCRDFSVKELTEAGLKILPSAGNFILVDFGDDEKAENTRLYLKDQGILVRQVGGYGLPTCLRISIGTEDEMKLAVQGIKDYIK